MSTTPAPFHRLSDGAPLMIVCRFSSAAPEVEVAEAAFKRLLSLFKGLPVYEVAWSREERDAGCVATFAVHDRGDLRRDIDDAAAAAAAAFHGP